MYQILIVDDDMNFRRSLVIQLEFEGFSVTEAESASQGLAYLEKHREGQKYPDIIITDVRMPEMNGNEFVVYLQEFCPNVPVIVISAFDLPEELAGYPFLRKPFKIKELIDTANALVQNSSLC